MNERYWDSNHVTLVNRDTFLIYYSVFYDIISIYKLYKKEDRVELWLKDGYLKCITEYNNRYFGDKIDSYIVLLEDTEGKGILIDLITREIILDGFSYKEVKNVEIRRNLSEKLNGYIFLVDEEHKLFSIYELGSGYSFRNQNYEDIEFFENGAIIDKKIVLADQYVRVCQNYRRRNYAFYNSTSRDYYIIINTRNTSVIKHSTESPDEDHPIIYVSFNGKNHYYNTVTEQFDDEYEDSNVDYMSYKDALYYGFEGYSEDELGI